MTRLRVLRALARFDVATVVDIGNAVGRTSESQRRTVWAHLQALVADGMATRLGENHIRYSVTEAGRQALRVAA